MSLRLLLLFLVLVQVGYLASRYRLRWDLTAEQKYSLTDSTRRVLAGLQDRVLIEAYFSDDESLPVAYRSHRAALRNLLDEYIELSKGRLVLQVFDPASDLNLRHKAERLGIQPQQATASATGAEADASYSVTEIWQGLRLRYADQKQLVLPFLQFQTSTFHYEAYLTPQIKNLTVAEKPKVGVLAYPSNPSSRERSQGYNLIMGSFTDRYDMQPLDLRQGALIPKDLSAVLLVRPKVLTDRQKFALDQFLMRGGKLVVFADGCEYEIREDREIRGQKISYDAADSELPFLQQLAKYGARVEERLVADCSHESFQILAQQVRDPSSGQMGLQEIYYPYNFRALFKDWGSPEMAAFIATRDGQVDKDLAAHYQKLFKPGIHQDHPLGQLIAKSMAPGFFWPCVVGIQDKLPAGVDGTVLLRTSPAAWAEPARIDVDPFGGSRDLQDRAGRLQQWMAQIQGRYALAQRQQFPLMVVLQGKFSSAFKGRAIPGAPVQAKNEEEQKDPLQEWDADQGPTPAPAAPQQPEDAAEQVILQAEQPGVLVVVGDADCIRDDFFASAYAQVSQAPYAPILGPTCKEPGGRNLAAYRFMANLLDYLVGDQDLVELQNKQVVDRSLSFAQADIAEENQLDYFRRQRRHAAMVRWSNILTPGILILLVGGAVWFRRRSQKRRFLASLK